MLCNLSWSLDGKYVVFENACSQPGLQWWKQIFVAPTNGSDLFQLTHFSEYDPDATQFPVFVFLYATYWIPSGNTLLISYTEVELIENGKRMGGFFLVSENGFSDPDNQSQSGVLGSNATWSPNGEYVIGNTASILGFPLERHFIGQLDNNAITILTLPESLPYGSCYENGAFWSPDSQYVVYPANRQGGACSHEPMEDQDIAVLSVSGINVVSNLISLSGNDRPVGWLTLP